MKVQPFFARYLEGQQPNNATTMRYPSDNEDAAQPSKLPLGGQMTTMRYPSDNEDAGQTVKVTGHATTLKFPSDSEDGGCTAKPPNSGYVTMKFPSDNEDGGAAAQHPSRGSKDPGTIDKALGQIDKLLQSLFDRLGLGSSSKEQAPVVTMKFPSDQEDAGHV